jgi:hypothetical protein
MIHGSDVSIGCVALGDIAAEDVFVLTAKVGLPNVRLLFCPVDFRTTDQVPNSADLPAWTGKLYAKLKTELEKLPAPSAAGT